MARFDPALEKLQQAMGGAHFHERDFVEGVLEKMSPSARLLTWRAPSQGSCSPSSSTETTMCWASPRCRRRTLHVCAAR
jgi:hypothetical protein